MSISIQPVYDAYINSYAWEKRRRRKLGEADHRCERCKDKERLEVHHRSYVHLGDEPMEDLEVLCHACHCEHHGWTPDAQRSAVPLDRIARMGRTASRTREEQETVRELIDRIGPLIETANRLAAEMPAMKARNRCKRAAQELGRALDEAIVGAAAIRLVRSK